MTTEPPPLPRAGLREWIAEHPRAALVAAAALAVCTWWMLHRNPAPAVVPVVVRTGTATAASSSGSSTQRVLLATANLLVTCDGCTEAEVEFDPSGAPARVRSRGGRLTIQAAISTTRHESASAYTAAVSTSAYSDATFARRTWRWQAGVGVAVPRTAVAVDVDRHVGELFGLEIGVGLGVEFPAGAYVPNRARARVVGSW